MHCALWSPHKSTIQTREQLEFVCWLPHRCVIKSESSMTWWSDTILCATWTSESTTHAKQTGNLVHALTDFHRQPTQNLSIVSVSLDVLRLYNYTIVLSAGVWTSSTHDWHHSSWVFLTSQRYQFPIQHVTSMSTIITITYYAMCFCCRQCLFFCVDFLLAGQQFDPLNQSSATRGLPQPTEKLEER